MICGLRKSTFLLEGEVDVGGVGDVDVRGGVLIDGEAGGGARGIGVDGVVGRKSVNRIHHGRQPYGKVRLLHR